MFQKHTKPFVKVWKINKPLDELEYAFVSFLHVDKSSLFAASEFFLKLQAVEFPESYQQLPWGWLNNTTIVLVSPHGGELHLPLGEERRGLDGHECSRLAKGLPIAQTAPSTIVY